MTHPFVQPVPMTAIDSEVLIEVASGMLLNGIDMNDTHEDQAQTLAQMLLEVIDSAIDVGRANMRVSRSEQVIEVLRRLDLV